MKYLNIFFFFIFLISELNAQRSHLESGDEYYHKRFYREAIQEYELALQEKVVVKKYYMTERVAKTYKMLFDYEKALEWYEKLIPFEENTAENLLDMARLQMNLEKYEEAKKTFSLYATKSEGKEINRYHQWCDWAMLNKDSVKKFSVHATPIETGSRSMGIAFYKEGLAYAQPQIQDFANKTAFYDLAYLKSKDSVQFEVPVSLTGSLNKSFYEGTPAFSKDQQILYYSGNASTITKYRPSKSEKAKVSKEGVNILKIYSSQFTNGNWGEPMELSFNSNEFDCVFPFLAEDQKTLYFVSNMPGGQGGYDIYRSTKNEDQTWSTPQNLGAEVNSPYDEMYPYVFNDTLYFSSKGHFGYGGADIYFALLSNGQTGKIQNMGKPFNSSKDDFSFIVKRENKLLTGYFSTNREGTHGYDKIYFFNQHKKPVYPDTIRGIAKNKITLIPMKDVKIALYKKSEKDSTEVLAQVTDLSGAVELIMDKNTPYTVTFDAEGFQRKTIEIPATDREDVLALFGELQMEPEIAKNTIIQIPNIYFDFDKATIREESFKVLAQIIDFLNDNPTIRVELSAHTDARGSDAYNLKLSQKRAESTVKYLVDHGINKSRLVPKGYGETKLQNNCKNGVKCSDEEHEKNRRVEMKVL